MGRIQDAMRRARAEKPAGEPAASILADDPFPAESSSTARQETVHDSASPLAPEDSDGAEAPFTVDEPSGPDHPGVSTVEPDTREAPSGNGLGHLDPSLAAKVVVDTRMVPTSREQYRRLAAALHHAQEANGLRVVMIASAAAGEGKSLTAANLALTLSESYRRSVLLVDGDLRRPSLHTFFGVSPESGLSEALDSPDEPSLTLFDLSARLTLMPAGRPTSDPMAGLSSVRMRALLEEARERFDWIIIDTPPVGVLSDANLLSAMVDGVLLVIKAGSTPFQLVQRAVETIGADRVLGTVLNRVDEASLQATYGYYYSYYASPRADVKAG